MNDRRQLPEKISTKEVVEKAASVIDEALVEIRTAHAMTWGIINLMMDRNDCSISPDEYKSRVDFIMNALEFRLRTASDVLDGKYSDIAQYQFLC